MSKYYVFFTRNILPQPNIASLVQVAHSANAAANLGYPAVLVYLRKGWSALNPVDLLFPFQPTKPDDKLAKIYNIQDQLKVADLPMPWPIDLWDSKWTSSSTIVSKYYLPIHLLKSTKIVHTRDWNFVKAAVKNGIPAIYEQHHHEDKNFEPAIVRHPLFQIAVTVADTVRDSMILNGMPPEKVITLHNGFNHLFLARQTEAAHNWRQQLLEDDRQHLAVYAGGLYPFKGVDMLVDVALELPGVQFAIAGGDSSQVTAYQQLAKSKQVNNIKFLGYLPQNQLASLLQAADVLTHPHCLTEAATFTSPLKFFDYMASGTPIVATEIASLMEFKSGNIAATWCEPDNPHHFAQSIRDSLTKYPRKSEGYAETLDFVKQFSWENRIERILNYVDEGVRSQIIH
ncbi:glycosyltransferase family 4 protein [Microcoleus vaginatus]|uniref:glycosyltransferase family 4 protein n=1 Tax=Microcoleus vaginatus TaxID=119532 RepID=UPI0016864573|nr:glycosyltransferase family 4 protein [Microcoleus sp. FACHB-84]MBD2007284.1 glycosyltransferase family 4 protein [Microcoleus sp. FACHB-45]